MTTPNERYRSIGHAREFLLRLLDPKLTPKVPKAIRKEARARLKHFPSELDLAEMTNMEKTVAAFKEIWK